MYMKTFITTKENLIKRYLNEITFLSEKEVSFSSGKKIRLKKYRECYFIEVEGLTRLIKIPKDSPMFIHHDLIQVDENIRYTIPNMLDGYVVNGNILLEGADGTGKTTISRELAQLGIITEDRNVPNISWMMEPQYSREERNETIRTYIESNPDKTIVFFYNSDEQELMSRIDGRTTNSAYDQFALYKQEKYLDTYSELKRLTNLKLYDVHGKSIYAITHDIMQFTKSIPKGLIRK